MKQYLLLLGTVCLGLICVVRPCEAEHFPGEVWYQYATPEEAGFSSEKLAEAKELFDSIDSAAMMAVFKGAVVVAWGDIENRYMCHSVRKSFLSALYGIHVHEDRIDLDKTLAELGIDDNQPSLTDSEKQARIVDLLKARSGVYHTAAYETAQAKARRPKRGSHAPGTFWYYNNWDFNTLGTIFEQESGKKIFEEFRERFAAPLGMQDYRVRDGYYHLEEENSIHPAYPFRMSARDMARFGLLFLNNGRWNERQILPGEWIDESTRSYSDTGDSGYGYMWWVTEVLDSRMFSARGVGNQRIDVLPRQELVLINRADTFHGKGVDNDDLDALRGKILMAKTGKPKTSPQLRPMPMRSNRFDLVTLEPELLKKYVREYQYASGRTIPVTMEDGVLIAELRTRFKFDLLPTSETSFIVEGPNDPVYFETDDAGQPKQLIAELVLLEEGEKLVGEKRYVAAIEAFGMAAQYFPESLATHRGLGEARMRSGQPQQAGEHFRRCLELSEGDDRQQDLISRLIRWTKSNVNPALFEDYVGEYRLLPRFTLTVFLENDRLMAQPTGQAAVEILPESETEFFATAINARVQFVRNKEGKVTGCITRRGRQVLRGDKTLVRQDVETR